MDEVVAEEMAILPGMEELANLLYIVDYYDSGKYDVIIVDCSPPEIPSACLASLRCYDGGWRSCFPLDKPSTPCSALLSDQC